MKNKKQEVKTDADKFVDRVKGDSKKKATQVEVKPAVVRDIPNQMGRHGSDKEKDLNPEE